MKLSHLPNLICVFRIILVGPVVWSLLVGNYALTLLLFFVAGFSDGLDGFLARQFGWRTRVGAILDPLADKLLMVSVYVALTYLGLIPAWLTVTVVARDVVIVAGGLIYHFVFAPVVGRPTLVSKLNTATQLLYGFSVVAAAAFGWPGEVILLVLGTSVFVTTCVSGLDYVLTYSKMAWQVAHDTH